MLGLGWTEMLVIGVVALIFIGPKDLPVVMGRVGKVIGQIQRMGRDFQREINKSTGLDEVRSLRNSITSPLKQTAEEIRREFSTMNKDGTQSPSGVIKPTDPKVESVTDEIRARAGMTPPKSSTELAAEYGFKPTETPAALAEKPAPIKAVRKPMTKKATVASADATTLTTSEAAPATVVAKAPRSRKKPVEATTATEASVAAPKKSRAPRKKPAPPAEEI